MTNPDLPTIAGPPEPVMIDCAKCGTPIRSLWAPGNRGLIESREYVLVADWLFHPKCWDRIVSDHLTEMPDAAALSLP
jgi:hypothetical protein